MIFSSHDHPFLYYNTKTHGLTVIKVFFLKKKTKDINIIHKSKAHFTGLTFFFLCRITLMQSVDTTILTFFFFIFFSLNSYCEGKITLKFKVGQKGKFKPKWLHGVTSVKYHMGSLRWSSLHGINDWKREMGSCPQEDIFDYFLLRGNLSLSKH